MRDDNIRVMGNCVAVLEPEEYLESPRDDRDQFGTMLCWHSRYRLGDANSYADPRDFSLDMAFSADPEIEDLDDDTDEYWERVRAAFLKAVPVCLDLHLYDHSILRMSCDSFIGRAHHAEWDSGRVGYIYATAETIRREYGVPEGEPIPAEVLEKAKKLLRGEVEEFDQYLRGDVWYYRVYAIPEGLRADSTDSEILQYIGEEDPLGGEFELLDSCGGLYGEDYAWEEAQGVADYYTNKRKAA